MSVEVLEQPKVKVDIAPPSLWFVLVLNDDVTPFEFVIDVVMEVLHLDFVTAEQFAEDVHLKGQAAAGPFTKDIAETKASVIVQRARRAEFPLQAIIESE